MNAFFCEVLEECVMEPATLEAMAERLGTEKERVRNAMHNLRARNLGVITGKGICRATPQGRSWVRDGLTRPGRKLDPDAVGRVEAIVDAWAVVSGRLSRSGWTCEREGEQFIAYHPARQRRLQADTVSELLDMARRARAS